MFEVDAKKIRGLMFATKLSVTDIANSAGIAPATLANALRDGARANIATISKIADVFKIDGETLILHN